MVYPRLESDGDMKGVRRASVALILKQVFEINRLVRLNSFVGNTDYLELNSFSIMSQWKDLRTGEVCENFGVVVTARAVVFLISWRWLS